jgi:putative phosphoribosyl transferase
VTARPTTEGLPIGLFGAGTGAAAALWVAAGLESRIGAVVSRAGRPDLAGHRLGRVLAPTLLIVGAHDLVVAELNRTALSRLRCPARLVVVPGARHLFVEPGALAFAEDLAADWFTTCLGQPVPAAGTLAA